MGSGLLVLGRWEVSVSAVLATLVIMLSAWLVACVILERLLGWRVVALTLAENSWQDTQQWEVRAMAAFVHRGLPRCVQLLVTELRLEETAAADWRELRRWYEEHHPREDETLFGLIDMDADTGPW
jgi:hypothetical protein